MVPNRGDEKLEKGGTGRLRVGRDPSSQIRQESGGDEVRERVSRVTKEKERWEDPDTRCTVTVGESDWFGGPDC